MAFQIGAAKLLLQLALPLQIGVATWDFTVPFQNSFSSIESFKITYQINIASLHFY
jgi:hypothetical protein